MKSSMILVLFLIALSLSVVEARHVLLNDDEMDNLYRAGQEKRGKLNIYKDLAFLIGKTNWHP
jgi:hypothetical protein